MTALDLAQSHRRRRQAIARALESEAFVLWQRLDPRTLDKWASSAARLVFLLSAAQYAAAQSADRYVSTALEEQGGQESPAGGVVPAALAGVASDGRPLGSLLMNPVFATKAAIGQGATIPRAMATGQASLGLILRTQIADAGRVADGIAITARPRTGYVRMLVGKSCSRCAVLAGKYYKYNAGFSRHPGCDCIHVPAKGQAAAESEGLISDPREYFDSLSRKEQDKLFTNAGAQAIRDGADIGQVVNVRRGAAGLTPAGARITADEARMLRGGRERGRLQTTNVFGREVFISNEGMTTRGLAGQRLIAAGARAEREAAEMVTRLSRSGAVERQVGRRRVQTPRLMPESIYQLAESREHAIVLLRKFGYLI
jgi:hypothetical protein